MTQTAVATPTTQRFSYAPALDGLRAVAVVAVVLFHGVAFNKPGRFGSGGFLGVDIFFVLSGYLITSLLVIEAGRHGAIALRSFWGRRIRRLLPALLVMLLIVIAYTAMRGNGARNGTRGSVFATLLYVQNWYIIANPRRHASIVSHTWSLSIEEQWYLVWPVLLALGFRFLRARRWILIAVVAVAALASAIEMSSLYTSGERARTYWATDTRVQSLLVGATLALVMAALGPASTVGMRRVVSGLGVCGAIVVLGALATWSVRDSFVYRGGTFVFAVGTALLIAAAMQPGGSVLGRVLSARPFVAIGLVSYGIYLYHIPIFVVLNPVRVGFSGPALFAIRVAVTGTVAVLSLRYIEQPIRQGRVSTRQLWVGLPAAILLVVVLTLVVTRPKEHKVATPQPAAAAWAAVLRAYQDGAAAADPGDSKVLVAGGSEAASLQTGPRGVFDDGRVVGMAAGFSGCSAIGGAAQCSGRTEAYRAIASVFRPAVVAVVVEADDLRDRLVDGRLLSAGSPEWARYLTSQLDDTRAALMNPGGRFIVLVDQCGPPLQPKQATGAPVDIEAIANTAARGATTPREPVEVVDVAGVTCSARRRVSPQPADLTADEAARLWRWLAARVAAPTTP